MVQKGISMSDNIATHLQEWTTKSVVNHREQFSFWSDAICEKIFQLQIDRRNRGGFLASIQTHKLRSVSVNRVRSEEHIAELSNVGISRFREHYFKLHIQNSSIAIVHQHGCETILKPGDAILIDSLYPFRLDFPTTSDCCSVKIPREQLRPLLKDPRAATTSLIPARSPINKAIKHYIQFLVNTCKEPMTEDQLQLYLNNLLGLIAAGTSDGRESENQTFQESRISQIQRYIMTNLDDSELTPSKVANYFSISVSYLHKLFAKENQTFGHFLCEQRLECAAMSLQNQSNDNHTISELAYHFGFNDLSHFWRLFKKRYGMTPRQFRKPDSSS